VTEAAHVTVAKAADADAELGFPNRCDLIRHYLAWRAQPIRGVRRQRETKYGGFCIVCRDWTDGYRIHRIEGLIVLKNDDRSGLAGVILAARRYPNIPPLRSVLRWDHWLNSSSGHQDRASMKA
jgi:hypothetical protein